MLLFQNNFLPIVIYDALCIIMIASAFVAARLIHSCLILLQKLSYTHTRKNL